MEREKQFYIENYNGNSCEACGGYKGARLSFCRDCFFTLPRHMQVMLSGDITTDRYQNAWDDCYDYLGGA